MKIGLIIQGPLVSYGKTGKTIVYTPLQLVKSKNSMKNFDCVENVKNILGSSEKTFHETILVTWEDKNMPSSLDGSNVLILNDEHKFKGKVASLSGPRNWNNVLKQAKTTYEGVLALEKLGCEYVVKTRTDLKINTDLLYKLSTKAFKQNKVLINNGLRNGTRYLEVDDLILGADIQVMKDWWGSILKYKFFDGAHASVMRGLMWSLYGANDEIEIKDYFAVDPNNVSKNLYFKAVDAWKNKFFIIPNEFWKDTHFRGEQMSEDYYKFNHQEPIYGYSSQTDVLLILNSLVGTKWKLRLVEGILKKRLISFRLFKLKFKYFLIPSLKFKFLKLFKSKK